MPKTVLLPLCLLLSLLFSHHIAAQTPMETEKNAPYSREWKTIDSLASQGLYRSALEKVEELYPRTLSDRQHGHAVKSLLYRQQYQEVLNEDGRWLALRSLEAEMQGHTGSLKAVLQSMLGEQYYEFFQRMRWQIGDRTPSTDTLSDDFASWTLADLVQHSTDLYLASTREALTRTVDADQYRQVMTKGRNTEGLRPTLYDQLLHRAVEHFKNNDAFLGEPRVYTDLNDRKLLGSVADFIGMELPVSDPVRSQVELIQLLQSALGWRSQRNQEAAFLDLDLLRLRLMHELVQRDDKDQLYEEALERLRNIHRSRPLEAEVRLAQMQWLWQQGRRYQAEDASTESLRWAYRDALAIGEDIQSRFPESMAAGRAANISGYILRPSLRMHIEQVYLPGRHGLVGLEYHNVEKIFFKLYEIEVDDYLYPSQEEEQLTKLLRRRALQSWNENLPDPGDYRQHFTETSFKTLPTGVYTLLVSDNRDFSVEGGAVISLSFWVSKLGLLTSNLPGEGLQVMVVDRETGAPIPGVNVTRWNHPGNRQPWVRGASQRTDAQGRLLITNYQERNFRLQLQRGRDELFPSNTFHFSRDLYRPRPQRQTHFFLDRSIYRPGQVIHFKALLTETDERRIPSIVPAGPVVVTLHNANGQEVERLELVTNSFGTASGTFTAPTGGLLGNFYLTSDNAGNASFRVEEYKRPRFEVEMESLEGQPKLNEEVTVSGRAIAYAGPALQGVPVRYTVRRRVQFPWFSPWAYRSYIPRNTAPFVLTTGETTTDENGRFNVSFIAEPDGDVATGRFPMFVYEVVADVTDVTGETHTGTKSVRLAEYALRIDLSAPDKHDRNEALTIQVNSTNLDGQVQPSVGNLKVERLQAPASTFVDRYWRKPDQMVLAPRYFRRQFQHFAFQDEDRVESWDVEEMQHSQVLNTAEGDSLTLNVTEWPVGVYRISYAVRTEKGDELSSTRILRIYDWEEGLFPKDQVMWVDQMTPSVEPEEEGRLRLGGVEEEAFVFVDVSRDNEMLLQQWEYARPTTEFRFRVREADRGGLALQLISVRWNRFFSDQQHWQVPWSNKELSITTETFRDKLYPDQEEEWILRIDGPQRDRVAAELVASMYDASLDQITPHNWQFSPFPYRAYSYRAWQASQFGGNSRNPMSRDWFTIPSPPARVYPELLGDRFGRATRASYGITSRRSNDQMDSAVVIDPSALPAAPAGGMAEEAGDMAVANSAKMEGAPPPAEPEASESAAPPAKVRTNLSETAFFFPELATDEAGRVVLKFRAPESLTRWKLQLFAHDQELAYALDTRTVITQKELMVLPNAPRFLREGDQLEFTAKVSNLSEQQLTGTVELEFFDIQSGDIINDRFGLSTDPQQFGLAPGQSQGVNWQVNVPRNATGVIGYRAIARSNQLLDGEEAALPVLTNQVLLTETLPLFVRGGKTETFRLRNLHSADESVRHQSLTFDLTSNPAWLAVKSMPYLLEYPHECTEQLVNRLFANSISAHLVEQFPQLKAVFDQWRRDPDALQSPLLANQELKSALIEETPWVLEAEDENLQRERIALLFDLDRMATEKAVALERLQQRQALDGGFSWFAGGGHSWHMTQYVVEELAHLQALGVSVLEGDPKTRQMLERALVFCDRKAGEAYQRLLEDVEAGRRSLQNDHLSTLLIHYLYVRSFFPDLPLDQELKEMHSFYLSQAIEYWTRKGLYEQGLIALTLHREQKPATADAILASLRERALRSEELGMYWPYREGFYWHQRPLETQALMMEVFHVLDAPAGELDELRLWLLRNKETNRWETTKATAAAIYALLISSRQGIGEGKLVQASFPRARNSQYRDRIEQAEASAEAGSGYYQVRWAGEEVDSDLATVRLRNRNEEPAWGGLYWQHFQDIDRVEVFEDTPLKVERALYRSQQTVSGEELIPLTEAPKPGDKITIRLILRTDRDMEYLHLKDLRASAFEPIDQLSGYRYQDGLGYYQSTTDVGTHFFFDQLPQGNYVIEYDVWVTYRGDFSSGLATFQCMYAPAYSSHSEGGRIKVE